MTNIKSLVDMLLKVFNAKVNQFPIYKKIRKNCENFGEKYEYCLFSEMPTIWCK